MTKTEEVRQQMMAAMKAGDRPRKDALSSLLAALKAKQIDKQAELTEAEENAVVAKELKELHETLDTTPADRTESIAEAKARIAVFEEFMPKQMDEKEIGAAIDATFAELGIETPAPSDKGKIMKALMPKVAGKADGKLVNELVSRRFS
ncbi:MAG TPA: GatB/YqeY domain-containing protein [Oscillospiraceae bacterium]|nr:GatB/YqeY domain-containing protein [Oscillospiraceae bacterium]HQQ89875.1 GatB/YqeY domain-containing protein [Oscillospiraceae bacterium]HRW56852.1 GatB/YqeY domain-containing protein [Oscillospiraceae bacterium]